MKLYNNKQQTQTKAIAILIGIICLMVAMHKSIYVLLIVLIIPILLVAYGAIYLMLIRNQKKEKNNTDLYVSNRNEFDNWYYNKIKCNEQQ
jgi:flagellar basal body-associated protein FliL